MADFDFWEFACCSRCHLPVASDSGAPTVPFWLTECGHIICNNHLKSDQSCASCGAQQIQVTPLQHDMEAPMSDWFRNVNSALDSVSFAAKFQFEVVASQARYYKTKYQRQKILSDKLKQANDALAFENAELRRKFPDTQSRHTVHDEQPADYINPNGKRRMVHPRQMDRPYSAASSSAHSGRPLSQGPERLTIPSTQRAPPIRLDPPAPMMLRSQEPPMHQRPGTSGFEERYRYAESSNPLAGLPPLPHHARTKPQRPLGATPPTPNLQPSSMAPQGHTSRSPFRATGTQHKPRASSNRFLPPGGLLRPPTSQVQTRIPLVPPPSAGHVPQVTSTSQPVSTSIPETSQRKRFVPRGPTPFASTFR